MAKDTDVNTAAPRRGFRTPPKSGAVRPGAPTPAVATPAAAAPAPAKPKTTPGQFINEVRAETRKISWPSWKETWITSVMVGIMVTLTAVFFLVVDGSLSFILQNILKLAG